ncbi:hypothetical protein HN011_003670 [Eciton burchellii]|nr:hypothetical protein HN011_003670 [Eciton burchellii]
MASKAWKVIQPHVPLIKFRWGNVRRTTVAPSVQPKTIQTPRNVGARATGPHVIVLPTVENIHLPPRYQRRPLDQREIDYINRGGPE